MPVYALSKALLFPDPEEATEEGLLAVGGDLSPTRLVLAYSRGIFPWPHEGMPLLWFSPDPRLVLTPERLHVPKSLRKTIRREPFEISFDRAFEEVIQSCADVPRSEGLGTWITKAMIAAYASLHKRGLAHSVEAWRDGRLVGGLYGVSLGAAFFGESMFASETDASKIAFVTLVEHLSRWRFHFVDCQVRTEHLVRFGAEEWPRRRFLDALGQALEEPTRQGPWQTDTPPG